MYLQILKIIKSSRHLNNADLAKQAGVSRAAITQWFQSEQRWANVKTEHIFQLSKNLNLSPQILLMPAADLSSLKTKFLWDFLYPDMESFLVALAQKRYPALARLLQVMGFYSAIKIIGTVVVTLFPKYKLHIKPNRRKQLETLWPLYNH